MLFFNISTVISSVFLKKNFQFKSKKLIFVLGSALHACQVKALKPIVIENIAECFGVSI